MLSALAHTAVCVPDVEAAVRWYADVLGMRVLSPPYRMDGEQIDQDMGELLAPPVVLKAAIVGFEASDHVLELIEYPERPGRPRAVDASLADHGLSHMAVLCEDVARTRGQLEQRGVHFLTSGVAGVAGLRTTWFADPFGTVFILLEKGDRSRPYYRQV